MSNAFRTLKITGRALSASGTVMVNNVPVHNGPFDSGILYKFITPVECHGHADVSIVLNHGQLVIDRVVVTYPALINNSVTGYYTFWQPIVRPMVVKDEFLNFPLIIDDKLTYKHLMFNGPTCWKITVNSNIPLYDGIEVDYDFVIDKQEHWEYNYVKFNRSSQDDILKLLNR